MTRSLAALALALGLVAAPAAAQRALLLRDDGLVAVPAPLSLAGCVERVVRGPTPAEANLGLRTAVPGGTALSAVVRRGDRVAITLGEDFLELRERAHELELAIEQLSKTVFTTTPGVVAVDLFVRTADGTVRPLTALLPAPPPLEPRTAARLGPSVENAVQGALSGRTIVVSPGHGYYWHGTLGWTTQRPSIGGLIEDVHTNEIAIRWLIPYLENLGARVISCRERGEIRHERVLDNDAGPPGYAETGVWTTSASTGYRGGTYRFATAASTTTATATWRVVLPEDGLYPVFVWYRAGTNRAPDARYAVQHAGGTESVTVDQTRDDRTWRHLGDYRFTAAEGAVITLTNDSATPGRVVIADAVRVGAGLGSIARGGSTSGQARWRECSRYWAEYAGAPSSVWNPISGGQDNDDDVTCRPRFAEWLGADAYLALHTNAGGGTGTDSFVYNGGATAGSTLLQDRVQTQVVQDIRAFYDPTWVDRGKKQANFGEVRLLRTMPGVLVELAFHDVAGSRDHDALKDPVFRKVAGRALARGVLRYFAPGAAFPAEPPEALRVTQDGARGLRVAWEPAANAVDYTIEQSVDGKGFTEVARTAQTAWSTGPLPHGTTLSFRVRAWNASGRSMPTEVLTAGTSHLGTAELLLVQGFDRLEATVPYHENTFDYLPRHARAIRDAGEFSLGFDAATNEAVRLSRVALSGYRCVDWACGEESTRHETFDALEQSLVRGYLAAGGRLLVSGSEIGWDLDTRGSTSDRDFHRTVLGAILIADDANTYGFRSVPGGIFAGLPPGTFDDGSQGTYDVDWPDVLAPADASSRLTLEYAVGAQGAAIERIAGAARVVYLGFPLETVTSDVLRAALMARALRFLLAPRELEAPAEIGLGAVAPLHITAPGSAGRFYWLFGSLATSPPTPLPGGGLLPLEFDGFFAASMTQGPIFQGFQGRLDASGRAQAGFSVPTLPVVLGLDFYFSGITLAVPSPPVLGTVLPWVRIGVR